MSKTTTTINYPTDLGSVVRLSVELNDDGSLSRVFTRAGKDITEQLSERQRLGMVLCAGTPAYIAKPATPATLKEDLFVFLLKLAETLTRGAENFIQARLRKRQ